LNSESNMYGVQAAEIRELFSDYVRGDADNLVLALSTEPLDDTARNAIEKSLESFGYGTRACTYVSLSGFERDTDADDAAVLDPQALFLLIEGLDPLCMVVCDSYAISVVHKAYRTALSPNAKTRVFGRTVAAFNDLESLLGSSTGKQKAWSVLKTLPRR